MNRMRPLPKGYLGQNHETIGSDILSVLRATSIPQSTLGPDLMDRLAGVQPDGWYPIELMLDLMDRLLTVSGPLGIRRMGRELFKLTHAEALRQAAPSARTIMYGFNDMYHRANRGTGIGGWKVISFEPGRAEMQKTTPHVCFMEEGIFLEALSTVGVGATITQPQCIRNGADACTLVVTSHIRDERWSG
jgi:hypothetical protein